MKKQFEAERKNMSMIKAQYEEKDLHVQKQLTMLQEERA